jgi:hypothetical protein
VASSFIIKLPLYVICLLLSFNSLLAHYATSWWVTGSNPDEVDFFNLPNPTSHTMALGSTQPLTEMSTRNIPGGKGWLARKADNLTVICELICLENVGASTSHNPMGLHGLLQGYLYLYLQNVLTANVEAIGLFLIGFLVTVYLNDARPSHS